MDSHKILKYTSMGAFVFLLLNYGWNYSNQYRYIDPPPSACATRTKIELAGNIFFLEVCFLKNYNFMNYDRLRVYSKNELLLAERFYQEYYDSPSNFFIQNEENRIIYIDDNDGRDVFHHVSLPPSWLDWLRARIP